MSGNKVRIGKIVGCHGVRGDVKVRPTSDDAGWLKKLGGITLKFADGSGEKNLEISEAKRHGPLVLLRFAGLDNRNDVEPLVGTHVYAERADLPAPAEGEYWADDLIGLAVVDAETGRRRGTVKDLLSSGGSDFLEIQFEEAKDTVVIPFIDRFFPQVTPEQGTLTVDFLTDFLSLANEPVTADRLEQ